MARITKKEQAKLLLNLEQELSIILNTIQKLTFEEFIPAATKIIELSAKIKILKFIE